MNIVLGVSGGIAAYKAPELVRRLQDTGAAVRVILTPNAARFVSPLSLAAVSGHGVISDQWGDPSTGGVDHIELARWADLLLIAPATANLIAKLTVGIADDALSTYALAHRKAIVVAPAMNTYMLAHPTVTENLGRLGDRGVEIIEPVDGLLACGDEGAGKMPDVPDLVEMVNSLVAKRDLEGRRVLITAGPTREAIDPVRYLSNRSSGKMGYAIAEAASRRGAQVTLVSGPTSLRVPANVEVTRVTTAEEMYEAVMGQLAGQHVVIKAAAVADYTPVEASQTKIKKSEAGEIEIRLKRTSDILEAIRAAEHKPFVVAFAAETTDVERYALEKLQRKDADLIVANDVSDASIGFDVDHNEVLMISRNGQRSTVPRASKFVVANRILDAVVEALAV
ncbi:MAG TPA: bifunctional phosphopantothenoylcysteine decarboxylase/phosphopantothenate--cysteine ligase CoaBC [Thermoanaerobaculia bacterium]|nr:bifunctional phosphopantothenoylcysteine decarboxylase/phosphopantothenate--cysteine ligase CoaBC [Thermoanaerobaculia bacterium]